MSSIIVANKYPMKIYLHQVFTTLVDESITYTQLPDDYDTIPNDCDVIGIAFWNGRFDDHSNIIDKLLAKTKKLLVFVPEPTVPPQVINFLNQYPQIHVFGNAKLNFEPACTYDTVPNWFIDIDNYYVTKDWAKQLILELTHSLAKPKMFDCLLGKQKTHRNIISAKYSTSKRKDEIIFTYFKDNILSGSWDFDIQQKVGTDALISLNGEIGRISAVLPIEIYNQSYYSIVAETIMSNAYSHFTEKTAKPILARRPFIMFAGQHFLKNLRKLGFQTFSDVIDESYDSIEDDTLRFNKAWEQVELLCEQDPAIVFEKLNSQLEHNFKHFLNTDWHKPIRDTLRSITSQDHCRS